ncbi:RepO-like protein [Campylobacter phage DA10]|nr:RepO-like protein [Campylobacter phage DA10]
MKYQISINQKAIIDNGLNIKGTSLETWALLDFLLFFQNANNLKKIQVDGREFIWINYKYIMENSPLCNFYNQSIKKHLDLLLNLNLIELYKEKSNDIYFRFTHKIECLFIDKNFTDLGKNLPTPRENFTNPLGKNLPTIIINNQEYINNNNNNIKEKNIKKEKKSLKNQALDLFKENEKEIKDFFSFEDWFEWVEYKIKKENKLTILTFSKNIKQLISFGHNAKLSIERSISAGWSGLFEIKQTNKAKAINYDNMFENPNGSDDFWCELIENGEYPSCENRKNLEKNSKNT